MRNHTHTHTNVDHNASDHLSVLILFLSCVVWICSIGRPAGARSQESQESFLQS